MPLCGKIHHFYTKICVKIKKTMAENEISNIIIGLAIDVHKALGPGLLENAYQECLFYKIKQLGLLVEKEKTMPLIFEEVQLDCAYRIDLLVENKFIIEIKSVESLTVIIWHKL